MGSLHLVELGLGLGPGFEEGLRKGHRVNSNSNPNPNPNPNPTLTLTLTLTLHLVERHREAHAHDHGVARVLDQVGDLALERRADLRSQGGG